jgi:asparagine synthase (glutamine-hydrolysing)
VRQCRIRSFAADGRYVLVFNGEVYKHGELRARLTVECGERRWQGHSDTETVLGMHWRVGLGYGAAGRTYALALLDRAEGQLRLVHYAGALRATRIMA